MAETAASLLRVRDWDRLYENNRSREMKRTNWFPMTNDLSADSFVELLAHPDGAAHLGVWTAVLMVASRTKPRGCLMREDGRPHTTESLARVTRLPEQVIRVAIERLLKIGLLEVGGNKPRKKSELGSHQGAENPRDPARKPQEGAVEGKGTEHHHQQGNRKEKKRTEPDGTERAGEGSTTEHSGARDGVVSDFPKKSDDDGQHPEGPYASPEDELKAIYLKKSGERITIAVLDAIRMNLELKGVSMADFVEEVHKHAHNEWRNPAGFLRDLSSRFRAKTLKASPPITAAEAEEKNYKCEFCGSRVRGEGALIRPNNKIEPCQCASPEYIARMRERGIFSEETQQ